MNASCWYTDVEMHGNIVRTMFHTHGAPFVKIL